MLEFKFDTQLLIEGRGLSEDEIGEYIAANIEGDSLIAVGGAPVTENYKDSIGADYYTPDAASASDVAYQILSA